MGLDRLRNKDINLEPKLSNMKPFKLSKSNLILLVNYNKKELYQPLIVDTIISKLEEQDSVSITPSDILALFSYVPIRFLQEYNHDDLTELDKKSGIVLSSRVEIIN